MAAGGLVYLNGAFLERAQAVVSVDDRGFVFGDGVYEVTRAIVTLLAGFLNMAEVERALLKPPAAWEAYDYYLRGTRAFWLGVTGPVASIYEARRLLEKSPQAGRTSIFERQ